MSVLETLVTLFTADTTDLKKGNDEAKKSTDDTEKKLKSTDVAAQKLGTSLVRAAASFGALIATAVSVGALVTGLKEAAASAKVLSDLSQQTGDSVESIDAWSNAIKSAGGDASQFQSTLVSMNNMLQDIQFNPKSASIPYFRWLGINIRNSKGEMKSFLELLPELASAFEKLNPKQAQMLGQKIGLDQSTIMLLQKGRNEVDAIIKKQKELGVITKQDTEIVNKFNEQWENTTHSFRTLFVMANATILPILTKVSEALENMAKFFIRHKDLIVGGLIAIGTTIAYFLLPMIKKATLAFAGIGGGIFIAIAAAALLYDDIKTFMEGGDSVIGRAIQKWPILGEIFKAIGDDIMLTIKNLNDFGTMLGGLIFDTVQLGKAITQWVVGAVESLFGWIQNVGVAMRSLLGLPQEGVSIDKNISVTNTGVPKIDPQKIAQSVIPVPGVDTQKIAESMELGKRAVSLADTSPLSSQTAGSILNNNRNSSSRNVDVRTGDINIQTQATDSQGIAFSIKDSLENQIRGAMGNFNDGVVA